MSTTYQTIGTHASLTVTGLATLASATYAESDGIDCYGGSNSDCVDYEVIVTVGAPTTPASNQQLLIWGKASADSGTYTSGPSSGTATTDEPNLGVNVALPLRSSGNKTMRFLLAQSFFGGVLPKYAKLTFKNEAGAVLTGATVTIAPVRILTQA